MNQCILSGELVSMPMEFNGGQEIRCLLKTRYPSPQESVRAGTAYVPCVVFDATREQLEVMRSKDFKKLRVELCGRIRRSNYENGDGERVYNTEIVANGSNMLIERVK